MSYYYSLVIEYHPRSLDELLDDIFEPYYEQLRQDAYEDQLELDYPTIHTIVDKNGLFARWYGYEDRRAVRRVDNKRHKKPRYSYHKARV